MAKVKAVPEGLHTITPQLVVNEGAKFIEFAKKAFGAEETIRMNHPDGKGIWHAALRIGDAILFVADEATGVMKSARSLGVTPFTIQINVEDAEQMFKRAVGAGATVTMPLSDMFWGDRYGQVLDSFGNTWAISQHVKDLTPQEMERGAKEAAARMGGKR